MFTLTIIPESVPSYESLGCFRANKRRKKALRRKYMNFGNQGNKKEQTTIDQCARIAQAEGYTYFAVQNTAECWSDEDAENRYDMLGKCTDGAGLKGKSMVYRLAGKNIFNPSILLFCHVTFLLMNTLTSRPSKQVSKYIFQNQ